jgi:hypothetical protein
MSYAKGALLASCSCRKSLSDKELFGAGRELHPTYQAILEEGEAIGEARGKAEEARRILLLLGRDKFGAPSVNVQAALDALADVNRLEELTVRLKHAASWQELLGLPSPRRRSPRQKPSS